MTEKDRLMMEEMMYGTNPEMYRKAAEALYSIYVHYKNAGFTPAQAFSLVKGMLLTTIETTLRITRE